MVLSSCMDSIYELPSKLFVSYKLIGRGFDCESERSKRPFAEKRENSQVKSFRLKAQIRHAIFFDGPGIPHICHESHENSHVNFFWPV